MPLQIIRQDITQTNCDAIVNSTNKNLFPSGGIDSAIHEAAGPGLLAECQRLGGCKVGQAKRTGAYAMPCKYIIHTVGPKWRGGLLGEEQLLQSCYQSSLKVAVDSGCKSIAFPLISSGASGFPKDRALRVAADTIGEYLLTHDLTVYIVVFGKEDYRISCSLFSDIQSYINDNFVSTRTIQLGRRTQANDGGLVSYETNYQKKRWDMDRGSTCIFIEEEIDESFSEMLLRKIAEKGITDSQCYKKANIDRKLFSKIRNNTYYQPSKSTAIAFAIALELSLDETNELLMKAGYALSHSNKFDLIVEYFIRGRNYSIPDINEALLAFNQNLLGY